MVKGEHFWCFFLTPFKPSFDTPKEIIQDITLKKVKGDINEIGNILSYLKSINAFHGPKHTLDGSLGNYGIYEDYESDEKDKIILVHDDLSSRTKEFEPWMVATVLKIRSSEQQPSYEWINYIDTGWEYWILETHPDPDYKKLKLLRYAFMIADRGLVIGSFIGSIGTVEYFIRNNEIYNEYPLKLHYEEEKLRWKDYELPLELPDITQVEINYRFLNELDNERYKFILRAINEYENLLMVSRSSSLLLVGLFSILELLLTHDDRNPSASRISWQLQKKIALLNNQFEEKIDFAKYFNCDKHTKTETIIEALYKKRSLIAHGNQISTSKNEQILQGGDDISFLRLLIRKIISYAIQHPQLIMDLKEC